MKTFEKKLLEFVEANGSFAAAGKVLVAVSGGADSTALLHAMASLKQAGHFKPKIFCEHINHQLRDAASDGDQDFIVAQAENLNIPITIKTVDVRAFAKENKLSIETAARELRIKSLIEEAKVRSINFIVTAHHADDNAETIFQRLSRGTGFRGLAGISPVRKFDEDIFFVRPMLDCDRAEIVEYLKKRNLKWREDGSNLDCQYRRNFIRHQLLPAIQKDCDGSIVEQLSDLAKAAGKLQVKTERQAEKVWQELAEVTSDKITVDLKSFENLQPLVKVELIRKSLAAIGSGEGDLGQVHYESILQLALQKVSGKRIELPSGFEVVSEYGKLIFSRPDGSCQTPPEVVEIELAIPGAVREGGYLVEAAILNAEMVGSARFKAGKNRFTEWFDLDKVKLPLVLRTSKKGEVFVPLGQCRPKKVAQFLVDSKVPGKIRSQSLVVADREKIIWIWPIRIGESAKTDAKTRNILQLQITLANF